MIKIDVEGAEPQVIRGATRLLKADRPIILSELHPVQLERASGMTADAFLGELRGIGYCAHAIERPAAASALGAPASLAEAERRREAGHYRNMVGPPIDKASDDAI